MADDMSSIHDKIKKLFALAERAGTTEEAESASSKAMEMVAKYAVDLAMLQEKRAGGRGKPSSRMVKVSAPYERPKVVLLNEIVSSNGAKCIWQKQNGVVVIVGFESDLDNIEFLYASLSVQALTEVERAARRTYLGSGGEARSFKTSFIYAYASKVGARMKELAREVKEETTGAALVLRSRSHEVDAAYRELFPRTHTSKVAARSMAGSTAGSRAGERADLGQSRFGGTRKALT